jgi:hypothetical protein
MAGRAVAEDSTAVTENTFDFKPFANLEERRTLEDGPLEAFLGDRIHVGN